MINLESFKSSIGHDRPPEKISVYLKALWLDAKGDWNAAHHLIDNMEDPTACWVHAYLHRKEGDNGNANYWYRKAGKKMPDQSLDEEWEAMVENLL